MLGNIVGSLLGGLFSGGNRDSSPSSRETTQAQGQGETNITVAQGANATFNIGSNGATTSQSPRTLTSKPATPTSTGASTSPNRPPTAATSPQTPGQQLTLALSPGMRLNIADA